jgi:hypothetical protein
LLVRTFPRSLIGVAFLLLMATGLLVACGDNGSATTTTSSSSTSNTGSTSNSANRPNRANLSGTISKYDASAKTLTIKTANGTTTTFSTTNARIVKSQKITTQDLGTLLGTSGVRISVTGQQGSDGTYTAQDVTVSDVTATGNGTPPTGMNGTPPAGGPQGTPPAGAPNGTPRANGMRRIMLQNAKFQNNQLTGTDQTGKSVTVTISSTTTLYKETTGTVSDLQVGQAVIVNPARPQGGNTSSSTEEARQIIVGDTAQQAAGAPQPGN